MRLYQVSDEAALADIAIKHPKIGNRQSARTMGAVSLCTENRRNDRRWLSKAKSSPLNCSPGMHVYTVSDPVFVNGRRSSVIGLRGPRRKRQQI
jgi:hypothetical protein